MYAVKKLSDDVYTARALDEGMQAASDEVQVAQWEEEWVLEGAVARPPNADELRQRARTAKLAALKALRDAIQYDAFLYDGHWIDCDKTARSNLTDFQLSLVSGAAPFPYQWRTADNVWIPLPDRETWAAMMQTFELYAKAAWTAFAAHESAIMASADPASYDIAAGAWPQTRIDKVSADG